MFSCLMIHNISMCSTVNMTCNICIQVCSVVFYAVLAKNGELFCTAFIIVLEINSAVFIVVSTVLCAVNCAVLVALSTVNLHLPLDSQDPVGLDK